LRLLEINHLQTYPIRHKVMWPDKSLDFIKLPGDETAVHFGIEQDHQLCSVVSLFVDLQTVQLRKLATLPNYQNKSFATTLIEHCITYSRDLNLELIWLNARIAKANFYKRFGFETTDKTFEKSGISYVIMELKLR